MCEWKETKIGDIATYVNRGIAPKYVDNDGIPIINQKCIRNGIISHEFIKYHNKEKKHAPEKKLIEGDILINSTGVGTAGRVGLFLLNDYTLVDSHVSILRLNKNNAVSQYVFYNLRYREDELEMTAEGSTGQIELKRDGIKDLDILLPPLPEQRAIASTLSSLDDKIDLLHRQNQTLETMAETLFRQWFVEEAEEGWESKVSELPIKIIDGDRGKNYPKKMELFNTGDCLFLSAKNVTTNGFNFNQCQFITSEKDSLLRSGKLKRNDIIITTRGTVGNIAYYNDLINFPNIRINSGMIILRTVPSVLDPIFVFCLISSNYFMSLIESQTSGSAQPQLPIRDFKQIKVLFPPKEKIDGFLIFAKPYLNKKFNNDSQIRTLTRLRDTLLPKLMSGEVRVQLSQGEAVA